MKYIKRDIEKKVEKTLEMGKIAVIYGARRTGKTTLSKHLMEKLSKGSYLYLNCDEPDIDEALTNKTSTELKSYIGDYRFLVIDEAQRVKNIGLTLKLIADNYSEMKIIATGSSSFELANGVNEPLTGRAFFLKLYPFSINELSRKYDDIELKRLLEEFLRYGTYPDVIGVAKVNVEVLLHDLVDNYLYKDILKFNRLKNDDLIRNLLEALALQVGSEVSLNELSKLLGVDIKTVKRYIQLLEKAFVVYRLRPLARNRRNEVGKFKKVYFYDVGIRNALLNNTNKLRLRNDVGMIWENFCVTERYKYLQSKDKFVESYFWRNYAGGEVDFIEESGGEIRGFEFKWQKDSFTKPKAFFENYPNAIDIKLINKDNFNDLWEEYDRIGVS